MQEYKLKSQETLYIKCSVPEDAPRIIDYCNKIGGETNYLSFGANEFNKSEKEERQILLDFQENPCKLHVYGEIDGQIVSLLDISAGHKERIAHSAEFGISVLKAHWGKGIATYMINYMLEWAKMTGIIKKVNLKVVSNNESAINLYRKFDFTMEGRLTKEFCVDGVYHDMIAMGYWIE